MCEHERLFYYTCYASGQDRKVWGRCRECAKSAWLTTHDGETLGEIERWMRELFDETEE